jgi:hypothetical protein
MLSIRGVKRRSWQVFGTLGGNWQTTQLVSPFRMCFLVVLNSYVTVAFGTLCSVLRLCVRVGTAGILGRTGNQQPRKSSSEVHFDRKSASGCLCCQAVLMPLKRMFLKQVPDRGGRTEEMRPSAADLMPAWMARDGSSSGGSFRGARGAALSPYRHALHCP